MKKQLIKIVSLSMSLMLFSMPLMACGKKESESVSYETWWTSESSEESSEEITTTTTETTEAPTSETEDPTIIENPFTDIEKDYEARKA